MPLMGRQEREIQEARHIWIGKGEGSVSLPCVAEKMQYQSKGCTERWVTLLYDHEITWSFIGCTRDPELCIPWVPRKAHTKCAKQSITWSLTRWSIHYYYSVHNYPFHSARACPPTATPEVCFSLGVHGVAERLGNRKKKADKMWIFSISWSYVFKHWVWP